MLDFDVLLKILNPNFQGIPNSIFIKRDYKAKQRFQNPQVAKLKIIYLNQEKLTIYITWKLNIKLDKINQETF